MTEIHLDEKESAFIKEQVEAGIYRDADEVVRAGLRLLGSDEGRKAELQRLINEGMDDIRNGRVHAYEKPGDLLKDILRMREEAGENTGAGH